MVEHSVAIRVTSSEDLQLASTRSYDVVVAHLGFDPMHSLHAFQAD